MDKKIVVVCGGVSSEREVSLRSGEAVYNALLWSGYKNVLLFDLKENNLSELLELRPDMAYLALHGQGGEDGCIQGALELAKIAYTGSGVETSALCMNKVLTKRILDAAGLPTAKYISVRKNEYRDVKELAEYLMQIIKLPMVLKAPRQGSSIGVVIVKNECQIKHAIEEIFTYDDELMAEEFIEGIELTLPIMGNRELIVLPDIEIVSEKEFYDFDAKYTEGLCSHIIPARISSEIRERVIEIGKNAYKSLNCRGLSRIDFIVDEEKGPIIIEINTLPGMTKTSLFPDAAQVAGISFEELVSSIVRYGFENQN